MQARVRWTSREVNRPVSAIRQTGKHVWRNLKVKVGKDHVTAQSERNSHSKIRGGKNLTIRYSYSRPSEQLIPNRRTLSYSDLSKI